MALDDGLVVAVGTVSMVAIAVDQRRYPVVAVARLGQNLRLLGRSEVGVGVLVAFLLGVASLGLYTYLLPVADAAGLGGWSFGLVWAWGVGGVLASAMIGRPIDAVDAVGSRGIWGDR